MQWTAFYPYAEGGQPFATWEEFWATYSPPESLYFYWDKQYHSNPPWLGNKDWDFWQLSGDKFKWPGITDTLDRPVALDINLFNGKQSLCWQKLGFVPKGQPPVPPDEGGGNGDTQPDPTAFAEMLAMLKELKLGQESLTDLVHQVEKTTTETAITLDKTEGTVEEIRGKFS